MSGGPAQGEPGGRRSAAPAAWVTVPTTLALALLTGCGTGGASDGPDVGTPMAAPGAPYAPTGWAQPTPPAPTFASPAPATPPPPDPTPATPTPATSKYRRPATHPSTRPSDDRGRGPDLSRRPALPTDRRKSTTPAATPRTPTTAPEQTGRPKRTTIRIGTWSARVVRGGQHEVDACRDAVQWAGPELGTENGYEMRTAVIVGHDHCGFDRFATLPVGTTVTVSGPRGTWRYEVYANYLTPGRGAPAAGLYWGDLTLQSCVGPDTGFSYLVRI